MKKLPEKTQLVEVENAGLVSLLGKQIMVFCCNYIYAGKLTGVNTDCIELANAGICYETGPLCDAKFKDFQKLPGPVHFVAMGSIESFGESGRQ